MSAAQELLLRIHKTAETGKNTTEKLIPMMKDRGLRAVAQMQLDEYHRIFMSSEILLRSNGVEPGGLSAVARVASNAAIDFSMLTDRSASNAAKLLMDTTDRGIQDIDSGLALYGVSASPESFNLASTLRDSLYRNRRELQRFKKSI